MLPILNRPIVDYVVEDCVKAGVEEIIFIVSKSGGAQIASYYSHNEGLENHLRQSGKNSLVSVITPPSIRFRYIVQKGDRKYGTAIPVALARNYIPPGDSALVLMGDDFLYRPDGGSDIADMVATTKAGQSALLGVRIDKSKVGRYGVIKLEGNQLVEIVETPQPSEAPSNLINVSKYVMTSELLDCVAAYAKEKVEKEYQIIVPINRYVQAGGVVEVSSHQGYYCDGGTLEGWIEANNLLYKLQKTNT